MFREWFTIEIDLGFLNQRLLEVQELDTQIIGFKHEIEKLADKHHLGEFQGEVEGVRATLELRQKELDDLGQRQRKLDGELEALMRKIKVEKDKLFSGTIMNPKELAGINEEIQSLEKRRDEMETEDLELMEAIDGSGEEVNAAEKKLSEASAGLDSAKSDYNAELADLEVHVRERKEERDLLKKDLDEDTLELYEKLLGSKAGLAVVRIEQGRSCGGCHIEFSMSQVDKFQHEEGYFRCEHCQRILIK